MQKGLNKKVNTLLCAAFVATLAGAVTTAVASTWQMQAPSAETVAADAFYMKEGASMRTNAPYGMRFRTIIGAEKYSEIMNSDISTDYKLGMYVFPAEYLDNANAYENSETGKYAELKEKLDFVFYDTANPTVEAVIETNEDGGYMTQGVITNMLYENFDKDYVGVGYIAKTVEGVTTYEYADFTEEDNVRSVAKVASIAYDMYKADTNVKAVFDEIIDGAYLKHLGVTYDMQTEKYTYEDNQYDTVADVMTARNTTFTVEMSESETMSVLGEKQLTATVKEDGTAVSYLSKYVAWKSNNEQVATVDKQGNVKAVGSGSASITASYKDVVATCAVTVADNRQTVSLDAVDYDLSKAAALTINGVAGEVIKATLGEADITADVTAGDNAISVAYETASAYTLGEQALTIETTEAIYTTTLTVASYVISDSDSMRAWYNDYIVPGATTYAVVSADFTYTGAALAGVNNPNEAWGVMSRLTGTFDGRGHVITGVTFGGQGSLFGRITSATLKNIAFVDMVQVRSNGNGIFARYGQFATIENVYVSLTTTTVGYAQDSFIGNISHATTMTNVILKMNPPSAVLNYEGGAGELTRTNVFAITSASYMYSTDTTGIYASATADFFTAVSAIQNSPFSVKNNNELYFGTVKVL